MPEINHLDLSQATLSQSTWHSGFQISVKVASKSRQLELDAVAVKWVVKSGAIGWVWRVASWPSYAFQNPV